MIIETHTNNPGELVRKSYTFYIKGLDGTDKLLTRLKA